jgi:hypothetical protein
MRADGPSVRLIFNKDSLITDKNIKGLQLVYAEATKPQKARAEVNEPARRTVAK